FQAEDGTRDFHVTGVQTCALPIYDAEADRYVGAGRRGGPGAADPRGGAECLEPVVVGPARGQARRVDVHGVVPRNGGDRVALRGIGRASCRERWEPPAVAGSTTRK